MTGTYALALLLAALQGQAVDPAGARAARDAAIAANDLAAQLTARADRARRDSLLGAALRSAREAVRLAPEDTGSLFALALVLGNTALSRGIRERVRMAVEIRELTLRVLAADSTHDGAHHILGRWNYEVMSLSGVERFIARKLLGGGVFGLASWDQAERELRGAVALDPGRLYHRLDLARVLVARREPAAAREQLGRIAALPDRAAADSVYRREARELAGRISPGRP